MAHPRAAPLNRLLPPRRLATASLVVAVIATGAVAVCPATAAEDGLVSVADVTYQVLPDEARVHVTIDAVATSHEDPEAEEPVTYAGISFAVQPGISNISAVSGDEPLTTRVSAATPSYTAIDVDFVQELAPEESTDYRVSFDMADPGGEPGRDLRIGSSLVAFSVWAFGTENEPGGSVTVVMPAGFVPEVQGTEMMRSDGAAGEIILSARPLNPFAFFAYVTADRPGAFVETRVRIPMGPESARIVIRAWEDDPEWGVRVRRLLRDGLPALSFLTGLPYPAGVPLRVEEAATSRLGEYAGLFEEATRQIRVRYDADALVALHEAAHVWFNASLFDARWVNEGWAEYYAVAAAERLGEAGETYQLTDDLLDARIPLDEWGGVGVENLDVEDFAYAASYELARRIAARTDLDGLREVWRAAANGDAAYLPLLGGAGAEAPAAPETVESWQRLLDLLEEHTERRYADLWAEWVLNPEQAAELDARQAARERYHVVAGVTAGWELPASIRVDLETWDFGSATAQLDLAAEVLADRRAIESRAARLHLRPPEALRNAFEGDGGLDAAAQVASVELHALASLSSATVALGREPSPLERIGLLWRRPADALADARDAFEGGRMTDAIRNAAAAQTERGASADIGADRSTLAATALLAVDGLALVAVSGRRLRRARRPGTLRTT